MIGMKGGTLAAPQPPFRNILTYPSLRAAHTPPQVLELDIDQYQFQGGRGAEERRYEMPYDVEVEVEAAIMEVAVAWGIRTDTVAPIVDEYGAALVRAALAQVQDEMANGYAVQKPFGYMVSLLRKGVIQAAAVSDVKGQADADVLYERYHRGKKYCPCCNPEPMSEQEWAELRGKL